MTATATAPTAVSPVTARAIVDDNKRRKYEFTFVKGDETSQKLARGVRVSMERSEFDSHQAIAAEMKTATEPVVVLNPSAVKLVAANIAEANSDDADVQNFHALLNQVIAHEDEQKAATKAAKEQEKAEKAEKKAPAADDKAERKIAALVNMLLAARGVTENVVNAALTEIDNA